MKNKKTEIIKPYEIHDYRFYNKLKPDTNAIYKSFELIGMYFIFVGLKRNALSEAWIKEFLSNSFIQELKSKAGIKSDELNDQEKKLVLDHLNIKKIVLSEDEKKDFKLFYKYYSDNPRYTFRNRGVDIIYQSMSKKNKLKYNRKILNRNISKRFMRRTGIAKCVMRAFEGTEQFTEEILSYIKANEVLRDIYYENIHSDDINNYLGFQHDLIKNRRNKTPFDGKRIQYFSRMERKIKVKIREFTTHIEEKSREREDKG